LIFSFSCFTFQYEQMCFQSIKGTCYKSIILLTEVPLCTIYVHFVSQRTLNLKFWKPLHAINTVGEPSVPRFSLLGHIYETFLHGHWFKPKRCTGMWRRVFFFIYKSFEMYGSGTENGISYSFYYLQHQGSMFWLRLCHLKPFHYIKHKYNCILMYISRLISQTSGYSIIRVTEWYKILKLL